MTFEIISNSPDETRGIGLALGAGCVGGELLWLFGTLGAGKTCFTQGLARGLGADRVEEVVSPTFTLHNRHEGRLTLNHIDCYRLGAGAEAQMNALGWDELFIDGDGVAAVEWPEYLGAARPRAGLEIHISAIDGDACGERRLITLRPLDSRHLELAREAMAR